MKKIHYLLRGLGGILVLLFWKIKNPDDPRLSMNYDFFQVLNPKGKKWYSKIIAKARHQSHMKSILTPYNFRLWLNAKHGSKESARLPRDTQNNQKNYDIDLWASVCKDDPNIYLMPNEIIERWKKLKLI